MRKTVQEFVKVLHDSWDFDENVQKLIFRVLVAERPRNGLPFGRTEQASRAISEVGIYLARNQRLANPNIMQNDFLHQMETAVDEQSMGESFRVALWVPRQYDGMRSVSVFEPPNARSRGGTSISCSLQ